MGTASAVERRAGQGGASRRAMRHRQRVVQKRKRIGYGVGALIVVALLIVGVVAIASGGDGESASEVPTLDFTLGDYYIAGDLTVPAGNYRLRAENVGLQPHDVGIRGGKITTTLLNGQSTEIDIGTLQPGTYELYCDVGDHVARGMVATLTVTEPVADSVAAGLVSVAR